MDFGLGAELHIGFPLTRRELSIPRKRDPSCNIQLSDMMILDIGPLRMFEQEGLA